MRLFILIIILTFSSAIQAQDQSKEFRINGNIRGLQTSNDHVYFSGRINGFYVVDSVRTTDGRFTFSGKSEPDMLMICYYRPGDPKMGALISFFMDEGEINITATYDTSMLNCVRDVKIEGSRNQNEIDRFETESMEALGKGRDFKKMKLEYNAAKKNNDTALLSAIWSVYKEYYIMLPDYKFQYVRSHPESFVSLHLLEGMILGSSENELDTVTALFQRLAPSRQSSVNGTKIWQAINFAARGMLIGKPAIDFFGPDPDGKTVKLSDYRGQYVLLEFWASWCSPCRAENPNVLKAFEKYKSKGFNILGVSLDSDTAEWKKALKEDKLPWTQTYDLRQKENSPTDLYGIAAVPDNFLINPDGIVIARGLRGKKIHQKLIEIYGY